VGDVAMNDEEREINNIKNRITILEENMEAMQTLINYQLSIINKDVSELKDGMNKLLNNGVLDSKVEKQFMVMSGKFFWKVFTGVLLATLTSGGLFTLLARMMAKR
jgi:uncharacterized membrane protein YjgN (DUF898 family)